MASVVFFRAANVGGHQVFQPGALAKKLGELGVVNLGAAGTYVVRLRVEGIDSLPLTIQNSKFSFDPNQKVVVA